MEIINLNGTEYIKRDTVKKMEKELTDLKKIMEQNLDFDESEQESKSEMVPKRQRQMKFPSDDEQSK